MLQQSVVSQCERAVFFYNHNFFRRFSTAEISGGGVTPARRFNIFVSTTKPRAIAYGNGSIFFFLALTFPLPMRRHLRVEACDASFPWLRPNLAFFYAKLPTSAELSRDRRSRRRKRIFTLRRYANSF